MALKLYSITAFEWSRVALLSILYNGPTSQAKGMWVWSLSGFRSLSLRSLLLFFALRPVTRPFVRQHRASKCSESLWSPSAVPKRHWPTKSVRIPKYATPRNMERGKFPSFRTSFAVQLHSTGDVISMTLPIGAVKLLVRALTRFIRMPSWTYQYFASPDRSLLCLQNINQTIMLYHQENLKINPMWIVSSLTLHE